MNTELDPENDPDHAKEEKLTDFLNFFEFMATLEKLGHLKPSEIEALFAYYLVRIKKSQSCVKYIQDYGFKNLSKLLQNTFSDER
ncbi:MAG: hypothetical protein ABIX01_21800 [Chitinophagaceae bacterium]